MDDLTTTSIETTAAPGIDLDVARAALASAKAAVQEQERAIIEEELRLAETVHADLSAQCETAQFEFDKINRAVETQHHTFLQSLTRKNGASAQLDAEMRNPPQADWDHGGYRPGARSAWRSKISQFVEECKTADAEHARELAKLSELQGQRRVAAQALEKLSWEASPAQVRVFELRRKLAALTPRTVANVAPWRPPEEADNPVLELTRDGLRALPDAVGPKFR